jgi:DUF4097 and DUF4098 domain-containing protein YvlB
MTTRSTVLAALLTGLAAAPALAQDFDWSGRIAQGRAIEIKNINGTVEAVAGSGSVRVTAVKRAGSRGDVDDISFQTIEHAGGVTICAVYPTPDNARQDNECAPGRGGRMNTHENNVRVDFRVEVPAGVDFFGRNVNGSVTATTIDGDVEAYTVNGDVEASATGVVRGGTVNGSVDFVMGAADWRDDLSVETVNGGISLTFLGTLDTEVEASTVNGSIESDWPLTVRGRFGPKRVNGTIGSGGGRTLTLSTVNGSIALRRR